MKNIKKGLLSILYKVSPKVDHVMVVGNMKGETNAIAMANSIAEHYPYKVYYVVKEETAQYLRPLMNDKVKLVKMGSFQYWVVSITCKYIFGTHGQSKNSKRQMTINIWHGVGHKKFGRGRGMGGHYADVTVATSDLSQDMLSYFFGVSKESVYIAGYPRNDELLRAYRQKESVKARLGEKIGAYDKIVFWMPTHRRQEPGIAFSSLGKKVESIFNVEGFDVAQFNTILKENNTLCLIKPHYFYRFDQEESKDMSNILLIGEEWIWDKKLNLYQLLACADVLITDFSSVMTDFSLLDLPIICYCADIKEVYEKDELFFDRKKLEDYLPSKLLTEQTEFFNELRETIGEGRDLYPAKRKTMRDLFFTYKDDQSAKRIAEYVFRS